MFKLIVLFSLVGLVAPVSAGAYLSILALSDTAGAQQRNPVTMNASLNSFGSACSQRPWPYYEEACIRDNRANAVDPRNMK